MPGRVRTVHLKITIGKFPTIEIIGWTRAAAPPQNSATMETITLSAVKLSKEPDGLRITHLKTGANILVSFAQLERWAIAKLRSLF